MKELKNCTLSLKLVAPNGASASRVVNPRDGGAEIIDDKEKLHALLEDMKKELFPRATRNTGPDLSTVVPEGKTPDVESSAGSGKKSARKSSKNS